MYGCLYVLVCVSAFNISHTYACIYALWSCLPFIVERIFGKKVFWIVRKEA